MTDDPRIAELLGYWFGPGGEPSEETYRKWFTKDPAFDAEIRTRFGALQADAASGALDAWRDTARGALALLLLLDQFPRNMFRDDAKAFSSDAAALAIARAMSRSELPAIQQMVALLPYQHAEDLATQDESVAAYEALVAAHPDQKLLAGGLDFARKHRDIIARFGRFPHRNAVLGRASTPEETEFLTQPGSSF